MGKSIRSKAKRSFRAKKREDSVYAAVHAARLNRLHKKLMEITLTDADGDAEIEEVSEFEDEKDEKAVEKLKKRQQGATMMQQEERNTGAVSNQVYLEYLRAGKGYIILPLLLLSVTLMQGAQVMSSYWLVYWQEKYVPLIILPHNP